MDQWDREHEHIDLLLVEGRITPEEAQQQHMDLDRDYRDAAIQAAEQAYENELNSW